MTLPSTANCWAAVRGAHSQCISRYSTANYKDRRGFGTRNPRNNDNGYHARVSGPGLLRTSGYRTLPCEAGQLHEAPISMISYPAYAKYLAPQGYSRCPRPFADFTFTACNGTNPPTDRRAILPVSATCQTPVLWPTSLYPCTSTRFQRFPQLRQ